MGSDDSSKEKPMHQVTVSDFMIGETEVTQELWQAVMGSNPSRFNGVDNPVEFVSWSDCQKFIANINRLTGKCFRLPTEAEWEYAACGGNASVGYKFAGSDNIDKVGWYTNNSQATTHPVATKSPNELGIYDMSGNVWEWCQDWYGDYGSDIQINPQGSLSGSARVIRGGSWMNDATTDCRVSRRLDLTPMARTSNLGFRLVLDAHEYVDLGLSVMWATCNVGASAPEEYGDYFAWGEVEPKEEYSWENYKWCDGTEQNITKYNATDGLKTLLPEDDAAHVNWGGEWRMPTGKEMQELFDYCTWERINTGGYKGYRVISKINGNSIFLPAAGFKNGVNHSSKESGNDIWSSSIGGAKSAKSINFINSDAEQRHLMTTFSRHYGFSVRPVLSKLTKTYYYGLTDEQFSMATSVWNMPNRGWGIADQSAIQGKTLRGIRLKVHTPGVLHIYKVPSLTETTEANFVKVATITATTTGVQDIDFDQPFYLSKEEYLVLCSPSDNSSLIGCYASKTTSIQMFYNRIGQSGGGENAQSSLMIDFY